MNAREGETGSDRILRSAIIAFTALGAVQLMAALVFHKVALGVDGAHNSVDGLVLFINLRARHWARLSVYSRLTCKLEPAAPLISSGIVVLATLGFTGYEAWIGGENGSGSGLAIALLTVSLVLNVVFALRLHNEEDHDHNSLNALVHLALDACSALIALIAYVAIVLGATDSWDQRAAWLGAVVIIVGHRKQAIRSISNYRSHQRPHVHTPPDHPHEPDHTH